MKRRIRVKVCCIANPEEAHTAIQFGADALGLVGEMPSGPGAIDDDTARTIAQQTPPTIATFLLTSRTSAAGIIDHIKYCATTTVQIVNHIDPKEYPEIIQQLPNVQRVQVIHVEDEGALALIEAYSPYVHAFLLDSGRPHAPLVELGGTGRTHDWRISQRFVQATTKPVILAGGLNATNVAAAVHQVQPFAVDLCSGVRTNNCLDTKELQAFMQALP